MDGNQPIDYLSYEMGYRVIMMASGPNVLKLLLEAKRPDLLSLTAAQRRIPFGDSSTVTTRLPDDKKAGDLKEFRITHQYFQDNVVAENGSYTTRSFLRYDSKSILVGRRSNTA